MRLAIKFSAALMAGVILVLTAQAVYNARQTAHLYEKQNRSDMYNVARDLSANASEIWALHGPKRTFVYLKRIDDARPLSDIRLIQGGELERYADRSNRIEVSRITNKENWYLIATAPIVVDGQTVALIEVKRRLRTERETYLQIVRTQISTAVTVAIICALIVFIMCALLVGKPVRRLTALAHSIAHGDFSTRAQKNRRDEIGMLEHELHLMTQKLAQTTEQVKKEQRGRTKVLEQLRHADRLSTVGKIASSMAHELGTPLNVVSGRAKMISSNQSLPQDTRDEATIISEQAERMTQIVRELLNFSRSEPLRLEKSYVENILDHARLLMQPIADERNITIEVMGPKELSASVDPGKILQVVTNLIMNAVHASADNGKIDVIVERRHIAEPKESRTEGFYVCITVRDHGVGIPQEKFQDIFKPFFTTKSDGAGTGLGLTVCHGIIRDHGGWFDLQSELGKGSSFTVCLPEEEGS